MALRRPPTRVELKADDIEEYNEVRLFVLYANVRIAWLFIYFATTYGSPLPIILYSSIRWLLFNFRLSKRMKWK